MDIIIAKELTYDDHVNIARIEESYFDKGLIASPDTTQSWYTANEQTLIVAKETRKASDDRIAGHISFIPIDDNIYELIGKGVFRDTDITPDDIESCSRPGTYKLYFCVICVSPSYRGKGISRILIKEYAKRILDLEKQGIIFSDVIADTITAEGRRFSEKVLGMEPKRVSKHNTQIMHVNKDAFYRNLKLIMS